MRINCPTCDLAFEVSDDQSGQKALCPECGTRFLIPVDGKGKGEILSFGKAGRDQKEEAQLSTELSVEGAQNEISGDDIAKDEVSDNQDSAVDHTEERGELKSAWGYLGVGVAIGLLFGFLIGWLVWRDPDTGATAPFGNSGDENASPFLLDKTD